MDVVRRDGGGPDEAGVIGRLLRHRRYGPRDPYAVGAHRDADGLPLRSLGVECEGVGVLPPELEDVTDLDAAGDLQGAAAAGAAIAVADLDRADLAGRLEITS